MKFIREFKEFALRGSIVDLAVGILIGGTLGTIAQSLVKDIFMPPVGLLLGKVNFTNLFVVLKNGPNEAHYKTLADAQNAGAITLNYGTFINNLVSFLVVAFFAFLIVRFLNNLRRRIEGVKNSEPTTKQCPYCISSIPLKATRCPNCTSQLN